LPSDPLTITIVTPSFNQGDFLERTIQSLQSQNYPHTQHIIIDGGSTDGTLSVLQKYDSVLAWVSEPDEGQAQAINKGFRQASGDIVTWLNSDDIYLPNALPLVAAFFNQNPDLDVVYGDYHLIDSRERVLLRKKEIPFDYNILLYGLDYISQPTVFFRRRMIETFGYLDESLHYGLDWEYWLRLARGGAQFGLLAQYLAATRLHTEAKTVQAPAQMLAEHQRIRSMYWDRHRFASKKQQRIYEWLLNKMYRLKRQAIKLAFRRTLDFPPASWTIKAQQKS
jgi:glycosyltransferase involved in cell wall biosynthesis